MASQVSQSALLKKLGPAFHQAATEQRAAPLEYGRQELPGGIKHGIAQLVDIKFDTHKDGANKDKVFFYAAATCIEPEFHGKVKCRGLRTSITEPCYDTPNKSRKTPADHGKFITNMLGLLNGRPLSDDFAPESDLAEIAAEILLQKPYIAFTTSEMPSAEAKQTPKGWFVVQKGRADVGPFPSEDKLKEKFPNIGGDPFIYQQWVGKVDYTPSDPNEEVQDDSTNGDQGGEELATEAAQLTEKLLPRGQVRGSLPMGPASSAGKKPIVKAPPVEETPDEVISDEGETVEGSSEVDVDALDTLVTKASAKDKKAQQELLDLATNVGVSEEDSNAAEDWIALRELIMAATGTTEGGGEEETTTEATTEPRKDPLKEEVYFFRPIVTDPKTKKSFPSKRAVECEILTVDPKTATVTLKQLDTGKVIGTVDPKSKKLVPTKILWSDLEEEGGSKPWADEVPY